MLGVVLQSTRASAVDCGYSVGGPSNNDCPRMVEDDRFFMCLSQNMNCQDRDVYHCAKNESGIWTEVCAPQTMCEKGGVTRVDINYITIVQIEVHCDKTKWLLIITHPAYI